MSISTKLIYMPNVSTHKYVNMYSCTSISALVNVNVRDSTSVCMCICMCLKLTSFLGRLEISPA